MISVVLATYNEEKNLATCLKSVADFADEIIVVDGTSQDKTAEIAHSFEAKVILTSNKQNFHINKQMALDAAQGQLILQLDADEVVDAELAAFVNQIQAQLTAHTLPTQPVAWYIKRKNYFLGTFLSKGGQYPDPVIRLLLRGKARLPQQNVHEQMQVDGETGMADGHLLHYPYPEFAKYMHKFNTYTSFEATRQHEAGLSNNLTNTLQYFLLQPLKTFFSLYLRHKGFVDGMAGLIFALMSSLHHPFVYLKVWELRHKG